MRSFRRRLASPALTAGLALCSVGSAHAVALDFVGELSIEVDTIDPIVIRSNGTASATLAGDHITALTLAPGVFSGARLGVAVTDPGAFPIVGLQGTFANGAADFAEDAGGGLGGPMPLDGRVKVCLFGSSCGSAVVNLSVPLSVVGTGGSAWVTGAVNITARGAPWTTATASVGTRAVEGGRKGPAGATSSTAQVGGQLNAVTPIYISTNIGASSVVPVFGFLRIGFGSLEFPACDDGLDNDGDGQIDFPDDTGCASRNDESETDPLHVCDDGLDNDGDGEIDYPTDPGCLSPDDPTEGPDIYCDVAMSKHTYEIGDAVVITSLRFTNLDSTPVPTRLRLQLQLPSSIRNNRIDAIDLGADGSFSIPGDFDKQLGPVTMFTLSPATPLRNGFEWRCAFEDPATGAVISEDRATFYLQ